MENPFFSIVILVKNYYHLVPFTLDSILKQTDQNLEIIIISHGAPQRDLELYRGYSDKVKEVISSEKQDLPSMCNLGFEKATGQYLQYVYPGNEFLIKNALEEIHGFIKEKKDPDIVMSQFVFRYDFSLPFVEKPMSFNFLKEGGFPPPFCAQFYAKSFIVSEKGFEKRYVFRPDFNLICLGFSQKKQIEHFPRVLIDYMLQNRSSHTRAALSFEILQILYKNFGFWKMISWLFAQDHLHILKTLFASIKASFVKA